MPTEVIDSPIQSNNSWGYSLVTPRTVLVVDAPILVGNAGSTAQVGLGIYSGENVVSSTPPSASRDRAPTRTQPAS